MRKALEKINGHGGAKPDVQPSNLPGKPEKSTRMRRTASPLSLPQQLTGISKEDREKITRTHKQWEEEEVYGHGAFMLIGEVLRLLPPA